ncbi:carboxymuconolactone decarboxylase family protein [Undibacterium sp. TJN25]|uniref:carboxymuconolactone decarboxylase family protein n=1 Tax=Undibacterium sp. TJN25 TaxID=3413056 RepID=UPI003BF0A679
MSRIAMIDQPSAGDEQQVLFNDMLAEFGGVPNIFKIVANSPVALRAFLGIGIIGKEGSLDAETRERIALALAQKNESEYCISAHTESGKKAGLSDSEIITARMGSSDNAHAAVAVKFALSLMEKKGDVGALELVEVRSSGYTESDIVEIFLHVGMNFLANMISKASRVELDSPTVTVLHAFHKGRKSKR